MYTFLRRRGRPSSDAQDLTQAFFAHLLERNILAHVTPEKGQLRTFLLGSLQHFLANDSATKGAVKMFAQGLSREVGARGITVNNVQPGPIDTDLNPTSGDWATPQTAVTALGRYG